MEPTQNKPGLDQRIAQWQQTITGGALTHDDIEELTTQLQDSMSEFSTKGLNEEDAWILAVHHIGSPKVLDAEFGKVNPDFLVNRNWMTLLWGAMGFLLLQTAVLQVPLFFGHISLPLVMGHITRVANENALYVLSAVVLLLFLFTSYNGHKLTAWFTKLLSKRSSVFSIAAIFFGLAAAFINFWIYSNALNRFSSHYNNNLNQAYSTLTVMFYLALIASTVFVTYKHHSQDIRTFKVFLNRVSWLQSFSFGLLADAVVDFSLSYHSTLLTCVIAICLFGYIGWILRYSKNAITSLVAAQFIPMSLFLFGWSVNPAARLYFLLIYSSTLLALVVGYALGKYRSRLNLA